MKQKDDEKKSTKVQTWEGAVSINTYEDYYIASIWVSFLAASEVSTYLS